MVEYIAIKNKVKAGRYMIGLYKKNAVLHAILWIIIYIVSAGFGDALSRYIGVDNSGTGILFFVLSILLYQYTKKNNWLSYYGFQKMDSETARKAIYYIPLVLLIALNGITGFNTDLGAVEITSIILWMVCVGFLEELIFRGFLYKAILARGSVFRAVLLSGLTFGIGHIVNLLRGYTGADQMMQITGAVAIGIMLTVLFEVTGNIVPGMIFHALFNISSSLSKDADLQTNIICMAAIVVLAAGYTGYLYRFIGNRELKGAEA